MSDRSEAMRAAIAGILTEHAEHPSDRGLITNFIVIAEVVGDDGEFWLKRMTDDNGAIWRQVGMLTAVADDLRDAMRGEDDE